MDKEYVPEKERTNDIYIIEYALALGKFTDEEINILNCCRLYLHVTTISELLTVDGTKIMKHMALCERPPWFKKTNYVTLQKRPSAYQRRVVWKRFFRHFTKDDRTVTGNINLGQRKTITSRLRRKAYYERETNVLYLW